MEGGAPAVKPADPGMLCRSAGVLAVAIAEAGASAEIARLLVASGRVAATDRDYAERVSTATKRFFDVFPQVLEAALREAVEADEELFADIRTWFTQPRESYTVDELAAMLRIPLDDARRMFPDVRQVEWTDALVTATLAGLLRPFDIERALGADFVQARSGSGWRTIPVLIRIPRFAAEAIGRESAIPQSMPLAHRIERLVLEIYRPENSGP